jgi:hypothetical protein
MLETAPGSAKAIQRTCVWPVAEAFTALILPDYYMQHRAFQAMVPQQSPARVG